MEQEDEFIQRMRSILENDTMSIKEQVLDISRSTKELQKLQEEMLKECLKPVVYT